MVLVQGEDIPGGMIIEKIPSWIARWVAKNPDAVEGKTIGEIFNPVSKAFSAISDDVYAKRDICRGLHC